MWRTIFCACCALLAPSAALAQHFAPPEPLELVFEDTVDNLLDLADLSLEDLMNVSVVDLMNVPVVTSTLMEQSLLDAPSSTAVVTSKQIKQRGYRTIKDILNDIEGFNELADVNEEVGAFRGTYATTTNKTMTMIDGHRMNDMELGRYNLDQFIGFDIVERVEIVRGPGSALYGTGALNGVINIITKKGKDLAGTRTKIRAGPDALLGSITYGNAWDEVDVLFNFTFLQANGTEVGQPAALDFSPVGIPSRPGSVLLRAYPMNWAGFTKVTVNDTILTLRTAHFVRETPRGASGTLIHRDEEAFIAAYTEDDLYFNIQKTFLLRGNATLDVVPSIHYFRYREQSFLTLTSEEVPPNGTRSGVLTEHTVAQLKGTYRKQINDCLHLTVGADLFYSDWLRRDSLAINGAGDFVVTAGGAHLTDDTTQVGFLVQGEWDISNQLAFTFGFRVDRFEQVTDSSFTPRLGLVYSPCNEWTLKALYGESFLAPNPFQLGSSDPSFLGNPNLQPETFGGCDFIVNYTTETFGAEVDLFYNKAENFINSTTVAGGFQYQNGGVANYYGGHAILRFVPDKCINGNISYSYLSNASGTTAGFLVNGKIKSVPEHTFRYGVTSFPRENLSLSFWGRTYGETNVNDSLTGRTTLDYVTIFDLAASYDYRGGEYQFIVKNLFNSYYEIGDAGGARPLPREGITLEVAAAFLY